METDRRSDLARALQRGHDPSAPETDGQLKVDGGGVSAALPTDRAVFVQQGNAVIGHETIVGQRSSGVSAGQTPALSQPIERSTAAQIDGGAGDGG